MTLVLKTLTQQASEGAEELRYHALSDEGTLLLYDFSNLGSVSSSTLTNGDKVQDLGRQTSLQLGIDNKGSVQLYPSGESALTEGKGFTLDVPGASGSGLGLAISTDLFSYLASTNPHSVANIVYRIKESSPASVLFKAQQGNTMVAQNNLRVEVSDASKLAFAFGRGSIAFSDSLASNGDLIHLAIESRGEGEDIRIFYNGSFLKSKAGNNPNGFVAPSGYDKIGFLRTGPSPAIAVYLFSVTDLTKTDKTADEVVKETWDYANSQGKFSGMKKMPYVDTY